MNPGIPCMEVVFFSAKAQIDPYTVVERARAIGPWLERQPGFVSRTLVGPDLDGTFIDIVHWQSEAQALTAATDFMNEPTVATFMEMVDEKTVQMKHLPICF